MLRCVGQREVAKIIGGSGDSCRGLDKNQCFAPRQQSRVNQAGTGALDLESTEGNLPPSLLLFVSVEPVLGAEG